jgi:RNA polymerase sigma-70 factor, ECF subfamily
MADKLFEKFLRGEPGAIAGIVLAYFHPLTMYGLRWTRRQDVAEDAAMKALALLQEKASEFKDEIHIKKFLHKTVKNICLAATRVITRTTGLSENIPDSDAAQSRYIRESDLYSQWVIKKIKKGLQQLPKKRRHDFYAYFFESKSFKDIAAERGTSTDTVRQNVNYAIKQIQKYLKDKGYPGSFEKS